MAVSRAVLTNVYAAPDSCQDVRVAKEKAASIRALNRERITAAILDAARDQIAHSGASALSVRAITRELGMASSAIYRYFPSRDDLLTKLIIDSYESLGAAVEAAESRVPREDLTGRFRAICRSTRRWALDNQHEYFLIYGTPVPGYKAPQDTIAPATRVATLMITVLVEAAAAKATSGRQPAAPAELRRALSPMRSSVPDPVSDAEMANGLSTFSALFGAISFELGGQLHNVIRETETSRSAYFEFQIDGWIAALGW